MKNIFAFPPFLATALLVSHTALAQMNVPTQQTPNSVINDFKNVSQCTERIWPSYSWSKKKVLVVDATQALQTIFDVDSQNLTQLPLSAIPASQQALASTFSFFDSDGSRWMSLNMEFTKMAPNAHSVLELGVHEAFHHIIQSEHPGWVWRPGARGQEIPVRGEPRFYRAMVAKNLLTAFLTPNQQALSLQKARYWYDRWHAEFPSEDNSTTDGYEGTAQYAGLLGGALAELGCSTSESALRDLITMKMTTVFNTMLSVKRIQLDSEGYVIGALAAFILRFDSRINSWEPRVVSGETPLDILLKETQPVSEESSPKLYSQYNTNAVSAQQQLDQVLQPARSTLAEKSYVIVSFPESWKPGSTSFNGFYIEPAQQIQFAVTASDLNFSHANDLVTSKAGNVMIETMGKRACANASFSFVLKASELFTNGNQFALNGEYLKGRATGTLKNVSTYVKALCVGEGQTNL